ncbi:MAG TPA: hypothetical protein VJ044_17590 [Candidatus Hodarchaeales archaeon]|nr:hypothetical protein [Candidatus Hodarchaeales archaeon]
MAESVNLYLDQETREAFEKEALQYELSFSAYLRVLARAFVAWGRSKMDTPMSELRAEVRKIIEQESRRV